jgi:hypothetical protein
MKHTILFKHAPCTGKARLADTLRTHHFEQAFWCRQAVYQTPDKPVFA